MKELNITQGFGHILRRAIFKPHVVVKLTSDFVKLRLNPLEVMKYYVELLQDRAFWSHIQNEIKTAQENFPDPRLGGWMFGFPTNFVYPLVRLVKPEIVIETGVGPGGSSALILNALEKNKKGHLYSIDLPGNDAIVYPKIGRQFNIHVPPGYEVGWLVPNWLKQRWSLIVGDSKEILPTITVDVGRVDVFLHDSLHTDEHIMFELMTVFPYLSERGLLLCDDVNEYWSLAFIKFCKNNGIPYTVIGDRLGIAKRRY